MDTVDGKSNAHSGENQKASDAARSAPTAPHVSAETSPRTQLQQRMDGSLPTFEERAV